MYTRSYTDEQLIAAVARSRSWRGVLHALGLVATSAGSARSVRRPADRLGITYDHFTGQRRWTDAQLRAAIPASTSWLEVCRRLGLAAGGGTLTALQAHSVRLHLSTNHFGGRVPEPAEEPDAPASADPRHVRDAGSLFAATWFTLRGMRVSWPLEPCRYDLVVERDGTCRRVQVKTTTNVGGDAVVLMSNSRRRGRAVYGPDEIDRFFVLDGELTGYLIPYETVAGLGHLKLSHYRHFVVCRRGDLLSGASSPAPAPRSRSASR